MPQTTTSTSRTYGVINDDGTIVALGDVPRMLEGKVAIDGQEDDVALPGLILPEQLDLDVAKAGGAGAAGTAAGAKDAKLADGEGGLLQTADDLLADGAGGTDDADRVGHAEGGGGTRDERGAAAAAADAARTCEGRCGRAGTGEGNGRGGDKGLGAGEGESSCGQG